MQDADDASIVRLLVRVAAAAIFCLLCANVAGFFVIRDQFRSGAPGTQVELISIPPG